MEIQANSASSRLPRKAGTGWATACLGCEAQRGKYLQTFNCKDGPGGTTDFTGGICQTQKVWQQPAWSPSLTAAPCPTQEPHRLSATDLHIWAEVICNRFCNDGCRRQLLKQRDALFSPSTG